MFGKILSSTVKSYEFRVYSFLYVIKYIIVDYLCHLCGVILTLKSNGDDHQIDPAYNVNLNGFDRHPIHPIQIRPVEFDRSNWV